MKLPEAAKAAVFMGAGRPFEVQTFPLTKPERGTALLELAASGVCGTDLHIARGRLAQPDPLVIGHEFIGRVVDIAPGLGFEEGDTVVYNMAVPCGRCTLCREGNGANCTHFTVGYARDPRKAPHFFGGYGEYCYADAGSLLRLPEGVDALTACMFPCAGPTVVHALRYGGVYGEGMKRVRTAVVQGAGPLGLFSVLYLGMCGVENILLSVRHNSPSPRLETARKLAGGSALTVLTNQELEEGVRSVSGEGADLVIECSGAPEAFGQGLNLLRNCGVYLVPGQYSASGQISISPEIITFKALKIVGSSQYDASDVAEYLDILSRNVDKADVIRAGIRTFALDEVNEALAAAESHRYGKVVFAGERERSEV